VAGDLWLSGNDLLCQDDVDAFVAACTMIGGVVTTNGNNGICP
jgi:hypothetical protein